MYDQEDSRRLVAAVEIVSPRNKDGSEARDAFTSKCHAMLLEQVCVVIVDPVTTRSANLFAELAQRLGAGRLRWPIEAALCRVLPGPQFSGRAPRRNVGTCPGRRRRAAHFAAVDQRIAVRSPGTRADL